MATDQAQAEERDEAQAGSRWINREPSGEEVATWFTANVRMHKGLEHSNYVQGVTLIPAKEKYRTVEPAAGEAGEGGDVKLIEHERLVYTPYAKVETRVRYWWDYVDSLGDDVLGIVEPVKQAIITEGAARNDHLPAGFFIQPTQLAGSGSFAYFVGCTARVRLLKADTVEFVDARPSGLVERELQGIPLRQFMPGTKAVPLLDRWGADENALMKAETGAVGRALGMAGMLVIPGSGVATAEDMQEMAGQGAGAAAAALPTASEPPGEPAVAEMPLRARADELLKELEAYPDKLEEVNAWALAKKPRLVLSELTEESPALRGVVRQLERKLAEAKDA